MNMAFNQLHMWGYVANTHFVQTRRAQRRKDAGSNLHQSTWSSRGRLSGPAWASLRTRLSLSSSTHSCSQMRHAPLRRAQDAAERKGLKLERLSGGRSAARARSVRLAWGAAPHRRMRRKQAPCLQRHALHCRCRDLIAYGVAVAKDGDNELLGQGSPAAGCRSKQQQAQSQCTLMFVALFSLVINKCTFLSLAQPQICEAAGSPPLLGGVLPHLPVR